MTEQFENLSNPPIHEALIDFRVNFSVAPSESDFKNLTPLLESKYPNNHVVMKIDTTFELSEVGSSANQQTSFGGIRFQSANNEFVFQAQTDGFTLSKLKPYRNWDELLNEAKFLWSAYFDVLNPASIERIACRYINRLEFNGHDLDFDEYLTAAPQVPKALPQGVSKFFSQIEVPVKSENAIVVVSQALEGVSSESAAIILDLDVSKNKSYNLNQNQWWSDLETLRVLKNRFFFESITEKSRALFR